MAKILCSKSGVQFNCDHFPISLTQNESHHPIFDVSLKRLWKYFPKWQNDELTEIDSYLYFLSLLHSTELVEFRTAALRHAQTDAIIASNMESLYSTIGKIVQIRNPRFVLPRFVISHDTRNLTNVRHWLEVWNSQYEDFCNGLRDQDLRSKLQKREAALERLIKNPSLKPERYSHLLAAWAAEAAQFPDFPVNVNGNVITCSQYWQDIIQKCYVSHDIIQIPEADLKEVLAHCEDSIEMGSIFSHQLFTTLREGLSTLQGFFSIGSTSFSILSGNDDIGESNLQLLINDAPVTEPRRIDYPSEFAYLKAKMKYSIAASASVSTAAGDK